MGRWHTSRTDGNALMLYDALRKGGAAVFHIGRPMDAIVIYRGRMAMIDPKGRTRTEISKQQADLVRLFPDLCFLLYDEEDCAALLREMRGRAAFPLVQFQDGPPVRFPL